MYMLSVKSSKKSCLIEVMFSIVECNSLFIQYIQYPKGSNTLVNKVSKAFDDVRILGSCINLQVAKQFLFLHLRFKLPFVHLPRDLPLRLRTSKRDNTSKSGILFPRGRCCR